MKNIRDFLILLAIILLPNSANAADNYSATQGAGKTFRCIELGGTICYPGYINFNSSGTEIFTLATPGTVTLSNSSVSAIQSGTWTVQPGNTANSTPWLTSISQGGNTAVVKPASGAPAAADPALVVGISPNSWDVGSGTGGTKTQRVIIDSSQVAGALATSALQTTANTSLSTIATNTGAAIPAGANTIGTVGQLPYPVGATPITASATGTTGATTATLAGTGAKTTYICGYSIRANATAATTVTNTITGVVTATISAIMWVAPAASGIGVDEQIFSPCIPASGTNQGIGIVSGAPGSGGNVSSRGWGYQL